MPTGIVKWFNGRKGYGFIEPEDGGNDVFVHVTALKDSGIKFLNEGDKVSYELTENRGRMAAGNLSLDGESSSDSDEAPSDEVEEAAEEEAAEDEVAEADQDSLMDAMMSKLMEDSFTGGDDVLETENVVDVAVETPLICPICGAENPPGSSMCGTCSYTF